MRDLLSWLMLMTDETWLNHAARIRSNTTVTPGDIALEEMLFECERLAKHLHAQIEVPNAGRSPSLSPVSNREP